MPRSSAVQTRDHDYRERENDLNELFERMRAAPAEAQHFDV